MRIAPYESPGLGSPASTRRRDSEGTAPLQCGVHPLAAGSHEPLAHGGLSPGMGKGRPDPQPPPKAGPWRSVEDEANGCDGDQGKSDPNLQPTSEHRALQFLTKGVSSPNPSSPHPRFPMRSPDEGLVRSHLQNPSCSVSGGAQNSIQPRTRVLREDLDPTLCESVDHLWNRNREVGTCEEIYVPISSSAPLRGANSIPCRRWVVILDHLCRSSAPIQGLRWLIKDVSEDNMVRDLGASVSIRLVVVGMSIRGRETYLITTSEREGRDRSEEEEGRIFRGNKRI